VSTLDGTTIKIDAENLLVYAKAGVECAFSGTDGNPQGFATAIILSDSRAECNVAISTNVASLYSVCLQVAGSNFCSSESNIRIHSLTPVCALSVFPDAVANDGSGSHASVMLGVR